MFYITKKSNVTGETLYHISENRWTWDESKRTQYNTTEDAQNALDLALGKVRPKVGYTITPV